MSAMVNQQKDRLHSLTNGAFDVLKVPNYRNYFIGNLLSYVGLWMQVVALAWLVLQLTHSGVMLGLVIGATQLPLLLLGPYAGVVADRVPKHRLLFVTNGAACLFALTLGMLVLTGEVRVWMVFVLTVAGGIVTTFDRPTKNAFISEMVGKDLFLKSINANNMSNGVARIAGPAIAAVLIANVGV